MSDSLPAEVIVTELPGGVRYILPRRRWGTSAHLGLGALVGGLLGTAFMSFWLWLVGSHLFVNGGIQPDGGILLLFLAMGGWMLLMTLRIGLGGASRLVGHSEIELRGGILRGLSCWGPLHWSRRWPVAGLTRFEVHDATLADRPGRVYEETRAAAEYNAISAVWHMDEKPTQLAHGYPRGWLLPLARDLARRCRLAAGSDEVRAPAGAIDVVEEPLPNPAGFVDLLEQPADSRVLVEHAGDRLRLTLPRKAFGRREAVLTVHGDRLRVETRGRRGTGGQEWTRGQLSDIRVARVIDPEGPDSFDVHVEPHPGEGVRVRLPSGGEAEARWLATMLRRVLRMPDALAESRTPFLERAEQPPGSRIIQEPLSNGVNLVVPPAGYRHPGVRPYWLCAVGYSAIALAAGGVLYAVLDLAPLDDLRGLVAVLWCLPGLFAVGAAAAIEEVVRRARRHATLTVVGDTLLVERTNLYGSRQQEWRRSQVTDVRVGDTLEGCWAGPRVRRAVLDRTDPTWELHIHVIGGEIVRLLDGYGDAELQWLATVLRRALRVPASESPRVESPPCPAQ